MRRLVLLLVVWVAATARAQAQPLWQEDFETGSGQFSYDGWYSTNQGSTCGGAVFWKMDILPTGGWNGTRGVRITICDGLEQDNMGWYVDGTTVKPSGWSTGDTIYHRFRIYFDSPGYAWDGTGAQQNKMIDFGFSPDRIILTNERGHVSSNCNQLAALATTRGMFQIKSGVNTPCAGPSGDSGSTAIVQAGIWYHVQLGVHTDASGGAWYRLWINNNNEAAPDEEVTGFSRGTTDWDSSQVFGGFWTDARTGDTSWIVDDHQIDDAFDSTWYQSASAASGAGGAGRVRMRGAWALAPWVGVVPWMAWRRREGRVRVVGGES